MKTMKLSIIIPIYNVATTLCRCLDSIMAQGLDDCEVILVDDGSEDESGAMAERYAERCDYMTCYHKQNGGLSDARNYGVERAHGEYLTFVDSDDELAPDTYKPLLEILDNHPDYDILEYAVLQNQGFRNETLFNPESHVFVDSKEWLAYKGLEHCWAWNKIYKRKLFEGVLFPLGKKYEDVYLVSALLAKHPVIATTNLGTYLYHYNSQGIVARDSGNGLASLLEAQMELVKALHIDTRQRQWHRLYVNMLTSQLYAYQKNGKLWLLPQRVALYGYATRADYIKALMLDILGLRFTCWLFKYLHK